MDAERMTTIPAFKIRRAKCEDAHAIGEVHVASWRTTYRGLGIDAFLDAASADERAEMWARGLCNSESQSFNNSDNRSFVYVAVDDGRVVGFASGGPERSGDEEYRGELYALYLLEAYQRRGIGSNLLGSVAARLAESGRTSMLAWVLADNPARYFYEACGGQIVRKQSIEFGGKMFDEICYGWQNEE